MGFNFRNNTNSTVYIAYAYQNSNCRPVTYAKIGWYRVEPGQTRQVWSGYAGGRTFYYFAEDVFGRTWNGPYFTQIPNQAFHWCWNTGCSTCRNLGFRRIDVPVFYADYTINLLLTSSQGKSKSGNILTALPSKLKKVKPLLIKPMALPSKRKRGKPILSNHMALPSKLKRK